MLSTVVIRPGFRELLDYCRDNDHRFVITSHGLDFYIEEILKDAGYDGIEYHAARTDFLPDRLDVQYYGPAGEPLADGIKEQYLKSYQDQGYKVVFLGDGLSDIYAARHADYVFACKQLVEKCREENIPFKSFDDMFDVRDGLKQITGDLQG